MFQKPTFGTTSSGFGSFNASTASASPFGGGFKTTTNSAFGAQPAFGAAATAQPATGGGLFGGTQSSFGGSTSGGFGGGGFGFGASTSSGGLFGAGAQAAPLFGTPTAQPFQAKPAGFGFGGGAGAGGLFGAGGALFGQPAPLFGAGGFGQNAAPGTAHAKYNPVVGTDVVVKAGASQNINIKHHCITCMKEYEGKSLEELRLEDYTAGRKGSAAGVFGGFSQQPEAKPLFGGSTFGQPATTSAAGVFGGGGGFGQSGTFSFGGAPQNTTQTNTLFGASKPAFGATSTAGTSLFGATTTQAPTFGTATSTFGGFGTNTQTQPSTGLFGAKPATGGFGSTTSSGFGSFGSGGGLFGAKPAATPAAAPAFGSLNSSGFGAATSSAGGLFGAGGSFGKPAAAPAFGFSQPALGGGLGAGSFQSKPAAPAFGSLGGSLFAQPQQNTFKTGLEGGLGGGVFGAGLAAPQPFGGSSFMPNTSLSGASQSNVHEQILSLVARPYGDSPLFKGLVPDNSATAEEALKPTNPAAMAAVLAGDAHYRLTSPSARLRVLPRAPSHPQKSLFDGLEEYDASLDDQLTLKPSRKRLVLRPKASDSLDADRSQSRSAVTTTEEQTSQRDVPTQTERVKDTNGTDDADGGKIVSNNNNLEHSSEKHGSWLSSSKVSWSEKEKANEEESGSRLYPDLDKEIPSQLPERRSSWLTTAPLRPGPLSAETSAEHSVRELGVRPEPLDAHPELVLSGSPLCCARADYPCAACVKVARQIDSLFVSDEEPRPPSPHPAGVRLTRPGYYTIPSLEAMTEFLRPDGSCVVPHLTIGRLNYGNVFYNCEIDVAGLDLDELVHFLNKEVIVYPEDADKPPVGQGLNRRALVTLDRIWPRDKTERGPITDPERLLAMDYEGKLRRVCDKHDTQFVEYRPRTGSWVFRVEHFSKYGLTDSDEEDDPTPAVLKRQLAKEALQGSQALALTKPAAGLVGPGALGPGLGGLSGLAGPGLGGLGGIEDSLFAMQQTSLNLLNGAGKAFEMDTTEDNADSQSLYQDSSKGFGVKSPTAELARLENRQSHHVQLMKASIYAESEMELDDGCASPEADQQVPAPGSLLRRAPPPRAPRAAVRAPEDLPAPAQGERAEIYCVETEPDDGCASPEADQQVPAPGSLLRRAPPPRAPRAAVRAPEDLPAPAQGERAEIYCVETEPDDGCASPEADQQVPAPGSLLRRAPPPRAPRAAVRAPEDLPAPAQDLPMTPLMLQPEKIVLKFHRKVLPFKMTIAGKLGAAWLADSHVARARHSRAGFGPRAALAFPATRAALAALPAAADLSELGRYVRGRGEDDFSESVVCRLALGHDVPREHLDTLTQQMQTLLEWSEPEAGSCPRLRLRRAPRDRRRALRALREAAARARGRRPSFGVSGAYCHEVWTLCEALWGADLDNDDVPGTDALSVVGRHRALLRWLQAAAARATDAELAAPAAPDPNDPSDMHSERVWTLLLGGRLLEACRVSREHGDLHMATLIAQASGDNIYRSLVASQLSQWRECGAEAAVSSARRAALQLLAGLPAPRARLMQADWLRALHATARYICPAVPSLERVVRTYESFFAAEDEAPADLTIIEDDQPELRRPLPPYVDDYDVAVHQNGKQRRVLDLRYELIRARAFNSRPKLHPASHTPDPLDYSLCFLLGVWFDCPSAESVSGAADQLEAAGAWPRAVQALAYHPHERARAHLIRGVVSRHAPACAETEEQREQLALLARLGVPDSWVLLARAHRAQYERLPRVEAEHLLGAAQWNAAHRVLLDQLLPDAVLADDLRSVAPLLEKLHEAAERHEVSGWETGGNALYLYIRLQDEIRSLMSCSEARDAVQARLEALRPRLAAACRALAGLQATTPRHRAARAEMGVRLVQLALATREPPAQLAALLRALPVPPDYTAHARHMITMELAEQASESCAESASPRMRSHSH